MKKSFALRVDAEVYEAIEKWAADEFRSTNGQIEWILSDALKRAKRTCPMPSNVPNAPRKRKTHNKRKNNNETLCFSHNGDSGHDSPWT